MVIRKLDRSCSNLCQMQIAVNFQSLSNPPMAQRKESVPLIHLPKLPNIRWNRNILALGELFPIINGLIPSLRCDHYLPPHTTLAKRSPLGLDRREYIASVASHASLKAAGKPGRDAGDLAISDSKGRPERSERLKSKRALFYTSSVVILLTIRVIVNHLSL
ncbi:uncharacterized protein K460DRAFT_145097 [Cucurbitaria berberidis CBS 394.84]|uniref:Uncharacterized protein n=1 Tax=Cucurbitaria berberidis CBS 394.84 TaxID=1168544 RepID=A0A9P4GDC7_9PLEO|nr:uncharacterized protein K460DRAFT_145097 [Cucurbitaria berberidis CBS 394.84]KAF1843419.1 hypothetical protein K460DRAFT_145097 [Cucurbitaria berberidis CBS 394.84]